MHVTWKKGWIILLTIVIGISGLLEQFVQKENYAYAASGLWEKVGDTGLATSNGAYWYTTLYVYEGTPYIAYVDTSNGQKIYVMQYDGSSWEIVGNTAVSAGSAARPSLYVYNGTPYVAYVDFANANKTTVMKFNSVSWEAVGSVGFSAGGTDATSLFVYNGTPYVAYVDGGNSNKATVMKFNGSVWEALGGEGFTNGAVVSTSLSISNGIPYIAFADTSNSNKTTVMEYDEASLTWELVGNAQFSAGSASHLSLYVDNVTPYLAYRDDGNSGKATVMMYNGSSWEPVGNAGFSADAASFTSLSVDDGTPYVVYTDAGSASKATLMKYNGSSWESLGGAGFSENIAYYTSLYIYEGTPYVVYHDVGNYRNIAVMKWAIKYMLDYDGNGAASGNAPTGGGYDANADALIVGNTGGLDKTGYTFSGWNTAADGSGTDYVDGDTYTMGTEDVILYAQWTANSYSIVYDGNNAASGNAPIGGSYGYNTSVTVAGNTGGLVKTGYTFTGWNTEADGSGIDYAAGDTYTMGALGMTLYAQWTLNNYTVGYDGNGATSGSAPAGSSYGYNTGVTVVGNTGSLVKLGYTFAGWNTVQDGSGIDYTAGDNFTMGTTGVTLYAQWTVNSYTVAYDGNGATSGTAPAGGSYDYNTSITAAGNTGSLVKTGYTFAGWNTEADGSGNDYMAGASFTIGAAGVTLYAQWILNSYTVSYEGNGATSGNAPTGASYSFNVSVTVAGNTGSLVKTGHTFAGWNTEADGSGTDYAAGDTYTMGAAGLTLYAQWTINSYMLLYDGNGATTGNAPTGGNYEYSMDVTVLGNSGSLAKTGYTFAGWNTEADGSGTDYIAGDTYAMGASDETLYAKWTVNSYTLAYDGNGATSGNAPALGGHSYNTSVTVSGNTGNLVKTGYTFAGWNTEADRSGTDYAAGDTFTMGTAGVTLYAQWTINSYMLLYDGNGATTGNAPTGGNYEYSMDVTVSGNSGSLAKTGYTFAGWNTESNGSGTGYAAGDTYTMGASNEVLYAKWTANSYQLVYDENGATSGNAPAGGSYSYNTDITVLGKTGTLAKTGYMFVGWNTAADGSGTDYAPGAVYTMGTSGVTLYAQWTLGSYMLAYNGNGATTGGAPAGGSYNYNVNITVQGNTGTLVKTGYTFTGWNTAADGSGTDYIEGATYTMGVSGVTLYAQWLVNNYTVAYDGNGATSGNTPSGGSYNYNTIITMPGNTGSLTKTGYTFAGWNTVADGSGTNYAAGAAYTMGASGVMLYAKWQTSGSPGSPSSGSANPSSNETIKVYVQDGENNNSSLSSVVVITRVTDSTGKVKDNATLTGIETVKTVEQLKAAGSHTALIVFPDPKNQISELLFTLPSEATNQLTDGNIALNIATKHARVNIPTGSWQGLKESLYFRFTPLKDSKDQEAIHNRAAQSSVVQAVTGERGIETIGFPIMIESNIQNRVMMVELPLTDANLSEEQLPYLGVYIEHSDGGVELIRGEIAYEAGTSNPVIRFTANKFGTYTVIYSSDFSASFGHAILKAYISGYADGTFRPNNNVTRAQMATLLARAFSDKKALQSSRAYADVKAGHWAAAAIEKVTMLGLMGGYTDGTFKPEHTLTRGEMAAIVMKLLSNAASGTGGFKDTAGHWAEAAIKSVKAAGIMSGYTDGTFRPNRAITRAEAVVIINRLLDRKPLVNAEAVFSDVPKTYWAYGQIQAASVDHVAEQ